MLNKNRFNEFCDRLLLKTYGTKNWPGEENKTVESEVKELEVKERKRKPNFSSLEISVITESVKNIDLFSHRRRIRQQTKKVKSGRRLPRR